MLLLFRPHQIWLIAFLLPAIASADATVTTTAVCAATAAVPAASVGSEPDYAAINRVLTATDRQLRLTQLPKLIHELESQANGEAEAAAAHLRLALSQAQAADGQYDAATKTLKVLPLENSLAPEALSQLAEIELLRKQPDAAVRWLQQLAFLFPDEPLSVQGLLRAAAISTSGSLALLQESVRLANIQLDEARYWQKRAQQTDFMDAADTRRLPGSLWRLAKITLTNPIYTAADIKQESARQQLQCLLYLQSAHAALLQKNPMLLADLSGAVATLDVQLHMEKNELLGREAIFLAAAHDWKDCQKKGAADCQPLQNKRNEAGRTLTGWRNRIATLEKKMDFLRREKSALPARWQQDYRDSQALAGLLTERRSDAQRTMIPLLQSGIHDSLIKLEELAAQAHYQLALAQDPRLARKQGS